MRILETKIRKKLKEIFSSIERIKKNSNRLVICYESEGFNWLGIKRATKKWYNEEVILLPHIYSNSYLNKIQNSKLIHKIISLDFETVIFSGYTEYFSELANSLKKSNRHLKVKVIFHGTFAEFSDNAKAKAGYNLIIKDWNALVIQKIGIVSNQMQEFMHEKYSTLQLIPVDNHRLSQPKIFTPPLINIGCFTSKNFNKNIINQAIAVAEMKDYFLHLIEDLSDENILDQSKIIVHGLQSYKKFSTLLSTMDLNLHLSFSESWGQLAFESLQFGIPCLVGPNSTIYNESLTLKEKLTVFDITSPIQIQQKIEDVIDNIEEISVQCLIQFEILKTKSKQLLNEFNQS